jgi:hypothetical protein
MMLMASHSYFHSSRRRKIDMSKALKIVFVLHIIVALIFGIGLLVAPGTFLGWFKWLPIDPLLSRVLGAALLAFAWGSFIGFRTTETSVENAILQIGLVFDVLAAVGIARHLFFIPGYLWPVWLLFIIFVIFAILWLIFLLRKRA